jgi:ElaB/YqjD/DUF883 family membrane-anchored ribosome-binding protein
MMFLLDPPANHECEFDAQGRDSPHGFHQPRALFSGPSHHHPIHTVNTDHYPDPPLSQYPEAARDGARRAAEVVKEASQNASAAVHHAFDATKEASHSIFAQAGHGVERTKDYALHAVEAARDAAHHAGGAAMDMVQSARLKAEDSVATSKELVGRNPVPAVLGAFALGAAIGCLLMMTRRRQSIGVRYVDAPLESVREALLSALAPAAHRVHEGYDSARHRMGESICRAHRSSAGRAVDSMSDQIGRVGRNLKFW